MTALKSFPLLSFRFCRENKVRLENSAPYTPAENGKVERKWGTTTGMTRCLLDNAVLGEEYWTYAMNYAFYIKNYCFHSAIGETLYEKMYGSKPNVSFVKVFGCKAFSYIEKQFRVKLDHRAQEGIFLGFSNNSKTFIIGIPVEQGNYKITKTRNAKFHEDVMFCKAKNDRNQHSSLEGPSVENINFGDVNETEICNEPVAILNEETVENQISPLRRSARLNQNTNYEFSAEVGEILKCYAELPQNTNEALKNENWRDAMQQEYNSLIKNQVWELVPLPENVKAIGSKCILLTNLIVMVMSLNTKHVLWQKVIVNNKVLTTKTHTHQLLD